MPKKALDICEDFAYTKQFFTLTQKGHTRPTAEFGAPTLVWHVAFWPRMNEDPQDIKMLDPETGEIKNAEAVRKDYSRQLKRVVKDFDDFLVNLQARGRVPDAFDGRGPFAPGQPLDWVKRSSDDEAFDDFNVEASGFTLWWADEAVKGPFVNMMAGNKPVRPSTPYIRVRVQAEVLADYSAITFFVDAGKPWNKNPLHTLAELSRDPVSYGERRQKIFEHIENIKSICEERIEGVDQTTNIRFVDLPRLPEPSPVSGFDPTRLHGGFKGCAPALKAAGDYLYKDLWEEFCRDFDFNLTSIAGETDEIFANFRGLVMSTRGTATETIDPARSANPGTERFRRFEHGGKESGYASDATEPNAVVKAFLPFLRRIRPEADSRDWIATGLFDWRAIYLTSLGAQSEFMALDEEEFDAAAGAPHSIPDGNLPQRLRRMEGDPSTQPETLTACESFAKGRELAKTEQGDRPAPFRYLLLTKFEPHRKQVGRIIERINTIGTRRLYALKNWTLIEQAGKWVRVYGLQLDEVYRQWIEATKEVSNANDKELKTEFWDPVDDLIDRIPDSDPNKAEAQKIRKDYAQFPVRAGQALSEFVDALGSSKPQRWEKIKELVEKKTKPLRDLKEKRDLCLARTNQKAEKRLIGLTSSLDELGRSTIGGLSYRISRSKFYADLFDDAVRTLRVGHIESWWSYEQFARRGMVPALRSVAAVGDRMTRLRDRLQTVKQDILQSSIANQTEATRDNTYRLEVIQRELRELRLATRNVGNAMTDVAEILDSNRKTSDELRDAATKLRDAVKYDAVSAESMMKMTDRLGRHIKWFGYIVIAFGVISYIIIPIINPIINPLIVTISKYMIEILHSYFPILRDILQSH
jgi:hypothetical protein